MPSKEYSKLLSCMEEYRSVCDKKYFDLQNKFVSLNIKYQIEMTKNKILSKIIEQKFNIKIPMIYEEKTDGLHIYNSEDMLNLVSQNEKTPIVKKKREVFRSVKNAEHVDIQATEEKIKNVETSIDTIVNSHFSENIKEIQSNLFDAYTEFEKHGNVPQLNKIKKTHNQLLGKLSFVDYIESINSQINKLTIICGAKHYDEQKTQKILKNILSPLDCRLIMFPKYYDVPIEIDELNKFKLALDINVDHPKKYNPYDRDTLFQKFNNYSIALYPIYEIIKRNLINPYGFSSIVYMKMPSQGEEIEFPPPDPYHFYVLSKIEDGKQFWKIDFRLQDFSQDLSLNIKQHGICLFRKIYFDVFNDYIYRPNYKESAYALSHDCVQLINNLYEVIQWKSFCKKMQTLILENAKMVPTDNDKINLKTDDKYLKTEYLKYTDDVVKNKRDLIEQLFDVMPEENMEDCLRNL